MQLNMVAHLGTGRSRLVNLVLWILLYLSTCTAIPCTDYSNSLQNILHHKFCRTKSVLYFALIDACFVRARTTTLDDIYRHYAPNKVFKKKHEVHEEPDSEGEIEEFEGELTGYAVPASMPAGKIGKPGGGGGGE